MKAQPDLSPRRERVRRAIVLRGVEWRPSVNLPWLGALALAVTVLIFLRLDDGERAQLTKGAAHVGFLVQHGDATRRGQDGERLEPGDALRFVVTSREPTYVALLSRDAVGRARVYHPPAERAARVEPGPERPLDASVVLDATLGEERLYALSCAEPVELAPIVAALEATVGEPHWPASCAVQRISVSQGELTR